MLLVEIIKSHCGQSNNSQHDRQQKHSGVYLFRFLIVKPSPTWLEYQHYLWQDTHKILVRVDAALDVVHHWAVHKSGHQD